MTTILGIVCCVLSISGVILNNRQIRHCFTIWLVSNSISAGLHIYAGMWALAVRDVAFLLLAVEGFVLWKNKER